MSVKDGSHGSEMKYSGMRLRVDERSELVEGDDQMFCGEVLMARVAEGGFGSCAD